MAHAMPPAIFDKTLIISPNITNVSTRHIVFLTIVAYENDNNTGYIDKSLGKLSAFYDKALFKMFKLTVNNDKK